MNGEIKYIIIACAVCLLIGSGFGYVYRGEKTNNIYQIDTVYKTMQPRIIYLDTALPKVVYRERSVLIYDTLNIIRIDTLRYASLPFVAVLDTATNEGDSVRAKFWFPENIYTNIYAKPRTIKVPILTYKTEIKVRPLWIDILSHTGACVIGVLIGKQF